MPNVYDYTYGACVGGKPPIDTTIKLPPGITLGIKMFELTDEVEYEDYHSKDLKYPAKIIKNDLKSYTYPLVISYEIQGQEFIESLTADGRHSPEGKVRLFKKPKIKTLWININGLNKPRIGGSYDSREDADQAASEAYRVACLCLTFEEGQGLNGEAEKGQV